MVNPDADLGMAAQRGQMRSRAMRTERKQKTETLLKPEKRIGKKTITAGSTQKMSCSPPFHGHPQCTVLLQQ
ncbi:TPA: hypothetical protein ACHTOV_003654 [Enterobacter cancerogenus]|uniref:hypothetical protein n=1 Tax=Enterobacter cancerogenus TaxID=69218 RepID=UPI00156213D7|nr:hypothetical protein [Enterobacter cancerogenus]QZY39499.1 hypothetical protein HU826_24230 [Enterobacter cancerogenus]